MFRRCFAFGVSFVLITLWGGSFLHAAPSGPVVTRTVVTCSPWGPAPAVPPFQMAKVVDVEQSKVVGVSLEFVYSEPPQADIQRIGIEAPPDSENSSFRISAQGVKDWIRKQFSPDPKDDT